MLHEGAVSARVEDKKKPGLKQRILSEFREVFGMFLYLWVLFALFTYHKAIVLAQHGISYKAFGVAVINAFVLAKVMLVVEKMDLAAKLRGKPLVYPVLQKAIVLSVVFILFNIAETIAKGMWRGNSFVDSIPKYGGGSPAELIAVGLILAVALIPFFAFREVNRVLGKGVLGGLFLKRGTKIDTSGV
jgi:hypothetical protein